MILINKRRTSTSLARCPTYLARMARSADEVRAAQRLRFEVFNLELNEGLAESHFIGLDTTECSTRFSLVPDQRWFNTVVVEHKAATQLVFNDGLADPAAARSREGPAKGDDERLPYPGADG